MKRNKIGEIDHCCYPGCGADRHSAPDAPPFCGNHMVECAVFISREMDFPLLGPPKAPSAPSPPPAEPKSVVYYIRVGSFIKIGTTRNIGQRLRDLYIDHQPGALMATEPGGRELEAVRHREFNQDLVFANRELFTPSPRLLAWIAVLNGDN